MARPVLDAGRPGVGHRGRACGGWAPADGVGEIGLRCASIGTADLGHAVTGGCGVVLTAIVLAQAGFLGMYSFISPLLTDRAGIPTALVPVVLVGFGIGALVGTVLGGRFGDRYPWATIVAAVSLSAVGMLVLAAMSSHPTITVALVVLLGAAGLGANPVLIAQTLRYAGAGSTLASSLATAAFNLGTAVGSALAAATLSTSLGLVGPAALGAAGHRGLRWCAIAGSRRYRRYRTNLFNRQGESG